MEYCKHGVCKDSSNAICLECLNESSRNLLFKNPPELLPVISRRDFFAGLAMQALIGTHASETAAIYAVDGADALIAVLDRPKDAK